MANQKIHEYPLERFVYGDNDYYDIDYWDGSVYQTAKILGSTIKAAMLSGIAINLTAPDAFIVGGSPVDGTGTLTLTAAGLANQYIRGDGTLATFPASGGGGNNVNYYLNGGTPVTGVAGYYQMSKTAVIGLGVDFSLAGNGLISQWLTDIGDPNILEIPAGAWNFEIFFSASSAGGTPAFYIEVLKYDGTTFTSIADNSAAPENITSGTATDLYLSSVPMPLTTLLATDRISLRVYIVNSVIGRTITQHTQDSHLNQVITTFSSGISSINGLTKQTQYLAVGTSGTDFNIDSVTDTHTFNLPTASATNRGALSSANWSTFNGKQNAITLTTTGTGAATFISDVLNIPTPSAGGGSGIFGISNASGVYTYYATLTLAMAAATSGQVIEMFADVTETGAVSVTLKNGVNINGNGHTYTLSNSGTTNALIDNGVAVICEIFNIKIIRTLGATPSNVNNLGLSITSTTSEIKCNGVFFKNTNGTSILNQGNLWGVSAISINGTLGTIYSNGNIYDSYIESTNSNALYGNAGNIVNCIGIANTSGNGIYVQSTNGNVYNSYGKSLSGNGISGTGKFYKTIGVSTSGNAIEAAASSEFQQCIGISTSGLGISGNSYFAYQCRFISSSNYATGAGSNAEHYDCSHESTSNIGVFGYVGLKLYRGVIYSKWNNSLGHAFSQWSSGSGSVLNNVFLRVTNTSANCINSTVVTTINYAQNAFLGATISVNANITQGITNLEDTQGNQKL